MRFDREEVGAEGRDSRSSDENLWLGRSFADTITANGNHPRTFHYANLVTFGVRQDSYLTHPTHTVLEGGCRRSSPIDAPCDR